ncbi:hypothetical protein BKA82DRAFT_4332381 [Pisolithus tinctorius]|nr:hypothetical protein BKA82DRAFT_4332381 [Pisolithus tinctorius]
MDDILGNISKQWNKHHVVYMSNALMPCEMLEKEFCVHFVLSSPHAPPLELIGGVRKSIEKVADDGIIAWDCKLCQEVMLIPYKLFLASDNPMQAKECSHGGLKCNYFCQTCKVGGTTAKKKSDKGYCKIFKSGELRTPSSMLEDVKEQIELAKKPGGTDKVKMQSCEFEAALTGQSIDDVINPLLGMAGVNIHQDMPTEILHTILLSIVKYYCGQTVYILDKAHLLDTFQTCLESINKYGLNSPTLHANYIVQFKGGLIGKHFKSLAQVMPFLIYDLILQMVLKGWTVIDKLVVLLWHMEIDNIEDYLVCYIHY